jgi:hypothetical protein
MGPLTLNQAIYLGGAALICFFLNFSIGKTNFSLFIMICGLLLGSAIALAFVKIEGLTIPAAGKNFANYTINSKFFIWKRKQSPVFLSSTKKPVEEKKDTSESSPLKIKQSGKMDQLIKKIDFEK